MGDGLLLLYQHYTLTMLRKAVQNGNCFSLPASHMSSAGAPNWIPRKGLGAGQLVAKVVTGTGRYKVCQQNWMKTVKVKVCKEEVSWPDSIKPFWKKSETKSFFWSNISDQDTRCSANVLHLYECYQSSFKS